MPLTALVQPHDLVYQIQRSRKSWVSVEDPAHRSQYWRKCRLGPAGPTAFVAAWAERAVVGASPRGLELGHALVLKGGVEQVEFRIYFPVGLVPGCRGVAMSDDRQT